MLDEDSLDSLSRNFAERLFRDFGAWEQYASELSQEQEGDVQDAALEIVVPQPRGERVLHVATEDGEISVSFGMWHEHIGSFMGISDAEAIEQALELIHGIVAERYIVRVVHRDGKWAGSSLEDAGDAIAPPARGEITTLYSWLGTFDRTL